MHEVFMDKQQILLRFEQEAAGSAHCEPFSLAALFAECLSGLADRLTEEEFEQMTQIGTAIFQYGVSQSTKSIPVDDLLPASEWWARKIKCSLYH